MFQIVSCNKVTRALWRPLSMWKNGGDKKGRSIDCNKIYLRIWGNIDLLYDWRVYGNFKLPAVVIEACFGLWGDERKGTCRLSGNEFQERFLNCLWFITAEGPLNEEHFGQVQLCSGFFGFSIWSRFYSVQRCSMLVLNTLITAVVGGCDAAVPLAAGQRSVVVWLVMPEGTPDLPPSPCEA